VDQGIVERRVQQKSGVPMDAIINKWSILTLRPDMTEVVVALKGTNEEEPDPLWFYVDKI
jgi:hypothetical protein